jgi:hypothetical protein
MFTTTPSMTRPLWLLIDARTPGLQEDQPQQGHAGQWVGIKKVRDNICVVCFIDCDSGYFDLEIRMLELIGNPFGPRLSPM